MKILEIFGENRLKFVEKWKIINIWRMISIGPEKLRNVRAKCCAFWPKNEENFEIFWSKSLWKIDFFSHFLLNISWISGTSPKVYVYLWNITPDFYNNFSDFGANVPAFRLPTPLPFRIPWKIIPFSKTIFPVWGYSPFLILEAIVNNTSKLQTWSHLYLENIPS